jgi:glutamyl-Q tRNA(Asp) synthetase
VLAPDGQKLSKQTGARAVDVGSEAAAIAALRESARVLALPLAVTSGEDGARTPAEWLPKAVEAWRQVAPPLA